MLEWSVGLEKGPAGRWQPEISVEKEGLDLDPVRQVESTGDATPPAEEPVGPPSEARASRSRPSAEALRRGTGGGGTVLFDLETQRSAVDVGGWQNAHRMLVAVGVLCHLEEARWESFGEAEVNTLVARLEAADLVVGFNIRRFDYRVLSGYTGVDYRRTLPTLDLLEEIRQRLGFRLSLNHLAKETLGAEKSADGLQSLEWVKQGRLDLVEEYCRHDVEILRDLYLFGRRMGYVVYRDREERQVKLPIDW
jgi:DEAD/DEAH box helicase domain-containing protein